MAPPVILQTPSRPRVGVRLENSTFSGGEPIREYLVRFSIARALAPQELSSSRTVSASLLQRSFFELPAADLVALIVELRDGPASSSSMAWSPSASHRPKPWPDRPNPRALPSMLRNSNLTSWDHVLSISSASVNALGSSAFSSASTSLVDLSYLESLVPPPPQMDEEPDSSSSTFWTQRNIILIAACGGSGLVFLTVLTLCLCRRQRHLKRERLRRLQQGDPGW